MIYGYGLSKGLKLIIYSAVYDCGSLNVYYVLNMFDIYINVTILHCVFLLQAGSN